MNTIRICEFYKLDTIDRKVAYWLYSECPSELCYYLEFIASTGYQHKDIKLDAQRTFYELSNVGTDELKANSIA